MSPEVLEQPLSYEQERGKPMPSLNHAAVQSNLVLELSKQREVRVLSEFTLGIGGKPYTPDLSIYPRRKLDFDADVIRGETPPLAVVEIFSPTQPPRDVMEKKAVYLRHGVKSCWLVSPHLKAITICGPAGQEHTFTTGVAQDPWTGLSADVDFVFS